MQQLAREWRAAQASQAPVPPVAAVPPSPPVGRVSIDLFLSYSRKNLASMRTVRDCLREAELSVWTDEGLEPGTPAWASAIEDALGQAQALVVLLSPDAKASPWMGKEVTYAQALGKRVFTALVAGDTPVGAVPISLIDVQWVDARQDLRRAVTERLRPAILRHLHRPQMSMSPIEFDWVTVPAGEFLMGSDKSKDKQAYDVEIPQHKLYLPEFRIAKYPVTNAQFLEFVKATSREAPEHWNQGQIPAGKEDHPVVFVTLDDAIGFCEWVDARLPSEAEWEKAARGLDGRIWPWGNKKPNNELYHFNMNLGDTTIVGSYPKGASPYGVLDMASNVLEWTTSLWGEFADKPTYCYPYKPDDGRANNSASRNVLRVLCGGSFDSRDMEVRCTIRYFGSPRNGIYRRGFRVLSPGS